MSTTVTTPSGQPLQQQPGEFSGSAPAHIVSWQNKRIPPPSPLYVDVDDQLQAGAATSQTNEVVTVNYRLLRAADGVIMRGQFTIAPANTRVVKVEQQQLAEGFLLSVSVKAAAASTRGQTFVRLFIGAGPYGAGEPSYMLMSDYVTVAMAPAFPNGRQLAPSEGPGWLRAIHVPAPGAGTDWSLPVPANTRWRLQAVLCALITDAAGSARKVLLESVSTGNFSWQAEPSTLQPVSSEITYSFAPNLADRFDTTFGIASTSIPDGHLLSSANGDEINSLTLNIDPGDAWQGAVVSVEEWLDNV
jgi:hypothetical protein